MSMAAIAGPKYAVNPKTGQVQSYKDVNLSAVGNSTDTGMQQDNSRMFRQWGDPMAAAVAAPAAAVAQTQDAGVATAGSPSKNDVAYTGGDATALQAARGDFGVAGTTQRRRTGAAREKLSLLGY